MGKWTVAIFFSYGGLNWPAFKVSPLYFSTVFKQLFGAVVDFRKVTEYRDKITQTSGQTRINACRVLRLKLLLWYREKYTKFQRLSGVIALNGQWYLHILVRTNPFIYLVGVVVAVFEKTLNRVVK